MKSLLYGPAASIFPGRLMAAQSVLAICSVGVRGAAHGIWYIGSECCTQCAEPSKKQGKAGQVCGRSVVGRALPRCVRTRPRPVSFGSSTPSSHHTPSACVPNASHSANHACVWLFQGPEAQSKKSQSQDTTRVRRRAHKCIEFCIE